MRTIDDVRTSLKFYEGELQRESGIKRDHFIITGGNLSVVKKGNGPTGQYILDKGTPVPMVWETAKRKLAEFQEKCGDNIRLEIIKYSDWLLKNIEECKKLMECMQNSMSGNPAESASESNSESPRKSAPESMSGNPAESASESNSESPRKSAPESMSGNPAESTSKSYPVEMSCQSCPYEIKTCMICRFAVGINMKVFPWEVICDAPIKKN